jgi:hypothetical protein
MVFLSTQITVFPLLITCAIGLAIGCTRRDLGKRARWGISGFGLLLLSQLVATYVSYLMAYQLDADPAAQFSRTMAKLGFLKMSLILGGLIALIAAAFHRHEAPRSTEAGVS